MREVKALTDYYKKVIYADLISKNIKPDKYGGIRKSVKLHGASGISVRISGYGKTPRECAEKLAFAEIKHNSEAGLQRSEKRFNDVALEWFENSKSHADLAEKNIRNNERIFKYACALYGKYAIVCNWSFFVNGGIPSLSPNGELMAIPKPLNILSKRNTDSVYDIIKDCEQIFDRNDNITELSQNDAAGVIYEISDGSHTVAVIAPMGWQ